MGHCLTTTLKDMVDDTSLLKLGEIKGIARGNYVGRSPMLVAFLCTPSVSPLTLTLRLEGDGYFTNYDGTENYGKTRDVTTYSLTVKGAYIKATGPNLNVIVPNKYDLTYLENYYFGFDAEDYVGLSKTTYLRTNIFGDIKYLKYVSPDLNHMQSGTGKGIYGDIAVFAQFPNMNYVSINDVPGIYGDISAFTGKPMKILRLNNTSVEGNISSLAGCTQLTELLLENNNVSGNLSSLTGLSSIQDLRLGSNNVEGNISSLAGLTTLTNLVLAYNENVTGNLSSFANLTNLERLNIADTNITGDTSSLANLTNLTTFTYTNTAITGTWPLV